MKLIYEKIQEGYAFKYIKSSEDFHDFEFCEKMVFLLDDVFQMKSSLEGEVLGEIRHLF
jgi:hypothetical protein